MVPTSAPSVSTVSHTAQLARTVASGVTATAPATAAAAVRGAVARDSSGTAVAHRRAGLGARGAARPQRGEHQPRRGQIGHRHQPVRVVRHRVHRARRGPDDDGLAPPLRARHEHRPHGRAAQAEQPEDDPGQRRPPLRADLLVQRHRIAAHQRRLHPAQAEAVGVGLIPGGRGPERARAGHVPTLTGSTRSPWAIRRNSRRSGALSGHSPRAVIGETRGMQVRRIVDLSVPIGPDTQVYPGDPQPELTPHATLHRDGYNLLALHLGSQTGTHVDAPYHVRADGTRVDALDLALCTGPATVLDLSGTPPKTPITADRIGDLIADVPPRPIVLIHTGWARHYGTPAYFDHPFLHPDAVRRLLDRGVRTFCIDAPSIDPTPDSSLAAHLADRRRGRRHRRELPQPRAGRLARPVRLLPADQARRRRRRPRPRGGDGARRRSRPAAPAGTGLTPPAPGPPAARPAARAA